MSKVLPARIMWKAFLLGVLLVIVGIGVACRQSDQFVIPNERVVETELLARKFSGPAYFQRLSKQSESLPEEAIYLSVTAALKQAKQIAIERHLSPENTLKLEQLIDAMTEPSHSRLYGPRVNLLRLNLALDALQ